jgi:hypothetical protein
MIYNVFSLEYLPNNQQNDCVSDESNSENRVKH